jgi:protein-tyrosine phosphatase
MKSVLFVCVGNTCRSPLAAAITQHAAPGLQRIASAGINVRESSATDMTIRCADGHGLDLRRHTPRKLADSRPEDFDVVVTMDEDVESVVRRTHPHLRRIISWHVDDPYGKDLAAYEEVFQLLSKGVAELAECGDEQM